MDARGIIAQVRDGETPSAEALVWFAQGLASGAVTDAQAGAFAMAVLLRGFSDGGRVALTRAMRDSGRVLEWDLPGPVLDKHSTGGIGDCVSLLLAPALAVCGAYVPMISGRGLGHTGGTLDKLEAIPGFRTTLTDDHLLKQMKGVHCAIVAASADLAPADKRLYAIRDISGTVESIDLITASILSKKLAAGLEGLVLDVKCGSGAFMKTPERAEALALALVRTAQGAGCMTTALITDMSQPLATAAGNALEVIEVMETLTGTSVNAALWDLTCALGGEALALGGLAADAEDGAGRIAQALETGAAAEVFGRMVAAQGGPADFVERWPDRLPAAPIVREVPALDDGYISRIDGEALGHAVVHLGGGRLREGDRIHPAVGLSDLIGLGEEIGAGVPLGMVHAATEAAADAAIKAVQAAYTVGTSVLDEGPLVLKRIT
ncbi:MAG: thymidine phosphorylase [Pseudotabrizicola sp.]|uniref:thymidine phosphorylase n=1 Tax=Pseudotabrizicola sp. TaxID=2939647 RepID=UPI002718A5AB|nr:thymidine phosphorylase [Pseudotabrizicola sp.]MDO8882053.1 thymidine phosphorylase [Pseudotabrizicola sp.]MDP2080771.1 thymidine phosphorylase [Pseudotabrizicola sp.]MDZ7574643.1 thymidine phosphorylase [Pseudotabrizicola sp.]